MAKTKNHYMDLSQFKVKEGFRGRSAFIVQLWWIVQALLIAPSPQFFHGWRRFLWRLFGAKVGKNVLIRPSARVTYPWNVTLGDYVWIGDRAELYSLGTINIGNHSVISQGSYICAATHDYKCIDFPLINKTVTIQDEVWIATGVFIAPGVTIGEGAMIGAKAVVLNDVAPAKIVAGNPAKEIRDRQKNV